MSVYMLISDLYGKEIITTGGNRLGMVEDIIIDFDEGVVTKLLLARFEDISRSSNTRDFMKRNSVNFDRVKSISETIVVRNQQTP